jgi:hypothetical protein
VPIEPVLEAQEAPPLVPEAPTSSPNWVLAGAGAPTSAASTVDLDDLPADDADGGTVSLPLPGERPVALEAPPAGWGRAPMRPVAAPGRRPRLPEPRSSHPIIPPQVTAHPGLFGVAAVLCICLFFWVLRALPLGGWTFFVIVAIAVVAINAARKRR